MATVVLNVSALNAKSMSAPARVKQAEAPEPCPYCSSSMTDDMSSGLCAIDSNDVFIGGDERLRFQCYDGICEVGVDPLIPISIPVCRGR
jgi:hypothetical protein